MCLPYKEPDLILFPPQPSPEKRAGWAAGAKGGDHAEFSALGMF